MSSEPVTPTPSCPDCGGTEVEPIQYGIALPSRSFPYPTHGELTYTDDSPRWGCTDCAARFGKIGRDDSASLIYTPKEWQALLPKLLPKPVEMKEHGELWGGEGPDVIVIVDEQGVHVQKAKVDWGEISHPTVAGKTIETLPLNAPAMKVATAITRVWARQLSKYQWCARCNERLRSEHMHDDAICHGCAERYLGIVH